MIVSPSIASSNVLNVAEETKFADQYFDEIHVDIEDGVAVSGISFGMKMTRGIASLTDKPISLHLEVINPLTFLDDVAQIKPAFTFIQADVLENPLEVIKAFKAKGLEVGLAIGDRDLEKDFSEIYAITNCVLICTAFHADDAQIYQPSLGDLALKLANNGMKVWIDGGVNFDIYNQLKDTTIHAAVMGRGVFANKEYAVKAYSLNK